MEQDTKKTGDEQQNLSATYQQPVLGPVEALTSTRWLGSQFITTATVLATANVLILGFAVENKQAGLLLVGALATGVLLIAYWFVTRAVLPYLVEFIELNDGLFALVFIDTKRLDELEKIKAIRDRNDRKQALHQLEKSIFWQGSLGIAPRLFIVAIVLQIISTPILMTQFNWNLF